MNFINQNLSNYKICNLPLDNQGEEIAKYTMNILL